MSVNERLMEQGSWSVRLIDDTPLSVIEQITGTVDGGDKHGYFYDQIYITPVSLGQGMLDDTNVIGNALYAGRLDYIEEGGYSLRGPGLGAWLGDSNKKGPIYEVETGNDSPGLNFGGWMTALLPATMPIHLGTIIDAAPADLAPRIILYETPKDAINFICRWFGAEYKINPDATLDAGPATQIFQSTPQVIVTPRPTSDDPTIRGLETARINKESDIEDYATRMLAMVGGLGITNIAVGAADVSPATGYVDPFGNPAQIIQLLDIPEIAANVSQTMIDEFATNELAKATAKERIPLEAEIYGISQYVSVGDYIWAYDPPRQVIDPANRLFYRGEWMYPKKVRIYAYSWPIEEGMGFYFRRHDIGSSPTTWTYVDLTPYVEWETSVTQAEEGPEHALDPITGNELYSQF